jgi:hypothetical protein
MDLSPLKDLCRDQELEMPVEAAWNRAALDDDT